MGPSRVLRYIEFMAAASHLRTGMHLRINGALCAVLSSRVSGGVVSATLSNITTGETTTATFREDFRPVEVPVEREAMSYLFADTEHFWFMNTRTFEQVALSGPLLEKRRAFLEPGMIVSVNFVEGLPASVLFSSTVEARVSFALPLTHYQSKYKWQRVQLENGVEVTAPLCTKAGDTVRVDLDLLTVLDLRNRMEK
jgi:elongation factor P